jgi:hypothetical protein
MSSLIALPLPIPGVSGPATSLPGMVSTATDSAITSTVSTTVESTQLYVYDNILELNKNDVGPGITKVPALGGIEIFRGVGLDKYQILFNETTGFLEAGFETSLEQIGVVGASVVSSTVPGWNGSSFVPSTTFSPQFAGLTITGSLTANGQAMTFPADAGSNGYILKTDGAGVLSWSSDGVSSDFLTNGTTTTVETDRGGSANQVFIQADGVDVLNSTSTQTDSLVNMKLSAGITFSPTVITASTYTFLATDSFVRFDGTSSTTITLPLASSQPGQLIIVENNSTNSSTIILQRTGADLISGTSSSITLADRYDSVKFLSNGSGNWIIV